MTIASRLLRSPGAAIALLVAFVTACLGATPTAADAAGTSPGSPPCGFDYTTARTADPNVRVVQVSSYTALPAVTLSLRLDTMSAAFGYVLRSVAIDHAVEVFPHKRTFVSLPIQVSLPADATITAAVIEGSSATPTACDATSTPAPGMEAPGLASASVDAAAALRPDVTALEPPACREPFKAASIVGRPAEPEYSDTVRIQHMTGKVDVFVTLDARGAVSRTAVTASSGFGRLDQSALYAASRTRYAPMVVRCVPTAGWYVFTADYEVAP